MSTTVNPNTTIRSLSENLKAYKAEIRDKSLESNIDELDSLLETLKNQKNANSVIGNFSKRMSKKMDAATNPSTYIRAIMPKFMKTWHENLNEYDNRRKAIETREKLIEKQHQKQKAELTAELDALIDKDEELKTIFKDYSKEAARQALLKRQESEKINAADAEYTKNMEGISDRLKSIDEDAEKEWARRRGIQLVKIVEDSPTVEELAKIKEELHKKIEQDESEFWFLKQQKKAAAFEERIKKEALLEKNKGLKAWLSKKDKPTKKSDGLLDSLINGGISGLLAGIIPTLIKAGLIALIAAGVEKYLKDEEFQKNVNKIIKKFLETILEFMKEHWKGVLGALAIVFPIRTLTTIGALAMELYEILLAAAVRIRKLPIPRDDGMQQPIEIDEHAEHEREKQKEKEKGKPTGEKKDGEKKDKENKSNKDKAQEKKENKKKKDKERTTREKQEKDNRRQRDNPNRDKPTKGNKPSGPQKPTTPSRTPTPSKIPGPGKLGLRPGPTFWATLPLYTLWAASEDAENAKLGDGETFFGTIGDFGLWLSKTLGSDEVGKKRLEQNRASGTSTSSFKGPSMDEAIKHYEKQLKEAKTPEEKAAIKTALDGLYKLTDAKKSDAQVTTDLTVKAPAVDDKTGQLGPTSKIKISRLSQDAYDQLLHQLLKPAP